MYKKSEEIMGSLGLIPSVSTRNVAKNCFISGELGVGYKCLIGDITLSTQNFCC